MAWTQTDIDKLKQAIGRGARSLELNGEKVTYGSLSEMRKTLAMMEAEVNGTSPSSPTIVYPKTSRGL